MALDACLAASLSTAALHHPSTAPHLPRSLAYPGGQARNAPLPEPWTEHTDDGGNTYYFNEQLQEVSRIVRPSHLPKTPPTAKNAPPS